MAGIFYTTPLSRTSANGSSWAEHEALFPELQVFANVMLSAFRTQTPERFSGFQPSSAEAYIVTPETPMTSGVGFSFPSRRDNTVFVRTSHLTFWLQVNNGGSANPAASASAVGVVYDFSPDLRMDLATPVERLELAAFAEDGTVVGTHRTVRLDGGPEFDQDETRDRFLAQVHALSHAPGGSLSLATFEEEEMPLGRDFRVDPSTGRAEVLDEGTGSPADNRS